MNADTCLSYAIAITASPQCQGVKTALRFSQAAIKAGHTINTVFFYSDGCELGNKLRYTPSDELNVLEKWVELSKENGLKLQICSAAALARGVITENSPVKEAKALHNLHPSFHLSGLTEFILICDKSDRLIVFA